MNSVVVTVVFIHGLLNCIIVTAQFLPVRLYRQQYMKVGVVSADIWGFHGGEDFHVDVEAHYAVKYEYCTA